MRLLNQELQMALKRTQSTAAGSFSRIETHICCEARGAALRFKVRVYPLQPSTKTVDRGDDRLRAVSSAVVRHAEKEAGMRRRGGAKQERRGQGRPREV